MQLTIAEASERLGVTPRRVRALVERGQLEAVRRGSMWLTTDEAVDAFRRNSPGRGRPVATSTAWARLADLARDGDLAALGAARRDLRSRATHRTYSAPAMVLRRLRASEDAFLSGTEVLGIRRVDDPVDLYATTGAAERLVERSGAVPDPDGSLHLHILRRGEPLPELTRREQLVLAWCDLTDRADPAADVAALELWPDSIEVRQLVDVVSGHDAVPYTELRGFTDWLGRHPRLTALALATCPDPSGDPALDSLYAAIAETAAEDAGVEPPAWAATVPAAAPTATSALRPPARDVPSAFARRGIPVDRELFWHLR